MVGVLKPEVKARALRLWLSGLTYRVINEKTGVSLGAMNELVNEARRKEPSLDELRELNVMLRKGDSSVVDAIRGVKTLNRVNELGVSLDGLESFIKLSERISSERGVEPERFIEASIRLTGLEAKTGKSYEEVVKDFEERMKRIEDLEARAKGVQEENRKLVKVNAQLEGEIREAKEKLSLTLQELDHAISTKGRLEKLGLERVSNLARFVEDFELLGFDTNAVRELAGWRKSLAEMGIDPDRLESFIRERGPLEKQLRSIEEEISQGKARLKILTAMERDIQKRVGEIERVWGLLQQRYRNFGCSFCGAVTPYELRRFEAQTALARGEPLRITCIRCGTPNAFNPYVILASLGLEVLS